MTEYETDYQWGVVFKDGMWFGFPMGFVAGVVAAVIISHTWAFLDSRAALIYTSIVAPVDGQPSTQPERW